MAENLGTVKIIFDEQGGSSSSSQNETVSELKNIAGDMRKLVSGSMTGLSELFGGAGVRALGTSIGATTAVTAGYMATNAQQKGNIADWISENQANGSVKAGNYDIDQVQASAKKGDVEGLAKMLGTTSEKAKELTDRFTAMDQKILDGVVESIPKIGDAIEDMSDKSVSKVQELIDKFKELSMFGGGGNDWSSAKSVNGTGGFSGAANGIPETLSNGQPNPFYELSKPDMTMATNLANPVVSNNQTCTTTRTASPVINIFNTVSTDMSRAP